MRYILIPLALLSHSCSLPLSPEIGKMDSICAVQSLACFDSQAGIAIGNHVHSSHVISQDLPTVGYVNRWRYIIETTHPALSPQVQTAVFICIEAVVWPNGTGGMYVQAGGYWSLSLHPTDADVAAQLVSIAGSRECRFQNFTIRPYGTGTEILIEEPL